MIDYKVSENNKFFIFEFDIDFDGYEKESDFVLDIIWQEIIKVYGQQIQYELMYCSNPDTGKLFVEVKIR